VDAFILSRVFHTGAIEGRQPVKFFFYGLPSDCVVVGARSGFPALLLCLAVRTVARVAGVRPQPATVEEGLAAARRPSVECDSSLPHPLQLIRAPSGARRALASRSREHVLLRKTRAR